MLHLIPFLHGWAYLPTTWNPRDETALNQLNQVRDTCRGHATGYLLIMVLIYLLLSLITQNVIYIFFMAQDYLLSLFRILKSQQFLISAKHLYRYNSQFYCLSFLDDITPATPPISVTIYTFHIPRDSDNTHDSTHEFLISAEHTRC